MTRSLRRHRARVAKINHINLLRQGFSQLDWWRDRWWQPPHKVLMGEHKKLWNKLQHIRPMRREETQLLHLLRSARVDAEGLCWPCGRKPHDYYW